MAEYDPMDPPTFDAADDDDNDDGYEPAGAPDEPMDEESDYDPSSFSYGDGASAQADPAGDAQALKPPPSQTQAAPKQPQKVAGFIVEESDDEQEESAQPAPSQLNGSTGSQSGLGAVAVAAAQDVSLSSAPQDTAAQSTSLNGSTTLPLPASTSTPVPDTSSLQPSAPQQGKAVTPVASAQQSVAPTPQPSANGFSATPAQPAVSQPPARLPHDKVGQLEDRIKDDPKGDTAAWTALIDHYYDKGQYDYVRNVYDRFTAVFPTAVVIWIKYLQMEKELDETNRVVNILNQVLVQMPNVDIWRFYIDHVRRALPLINDVDGKNRGEITAAFEMTLNHVGIDPDAGSLWRDYIEFVKDGPGSVTGNSWQDEQKVDLLRKAYQRAIKIPHSETIQLWKEYESFEMGRHKGTGRKHVQEMSPHYVEARKAKVQIQQKLEGLDRGGLPRLPPIYGCAGEDEFGTQVEKFKGWIEWERDEDPLVYKGTEDDAWRKRVLYAYGQATMFLCFYPQIWFDAASWCFSQGLTTEGEQFLDSGIARNPESVLLAMMKAERVESSLSPGNTDEILITNGEKLDAPFEDVHTALYALRLKLIDKDKRVMQQIQEHYASLPADEDNADSQADEDEDDSAEQKPKTKDERMKAEIDAVKAASAAQLDVLKRTISYVWVAKMRAFRRVQGQGKPQKKGSDAKTVKGFRGVFAESRPRGQLSSDVYTASALMEWNCYKDPSANKIFDRVIKLFPTDENAILEYIKHLISQGDVTNARVVFESTIPKITNATDTTPEQKAAKCRPLFVFMHEYESKYGDLPQITKLEKRMTELYPDEPGIARFSNRLALPSFDAIDVQLLLSPTQAQPKTSVPPVASALAPGMASTEQGASPKVPEILLGPNGPYVASPKRPLDDSDADTPQRKFIRAESPLKGAAGLRIQSNKPALAASTGGGGGGFATKTFTPGNVAQQPPPMSIGPIPLPPMINQFLSLIPSASTFGALRWDTAKLVPFMASVNVDQARGMLATGQLVRR